MGIGRHLEVGVSSMSRYHVCVKKEALHFGTNRMDEAFELALHLKRQGRDVEIIDNTTGRELECPQSNRSKRSSHIAKA
jgi:hypothetical protein